MQTRSAFRHHSGTRSAQNVPARRAFQSGSGMHYAFAYFSHLQIPHHLREGRGISTVACYVTVLVGKRVCTVTGGNFEEEHVKMYYRSGTVGSCMCVSRQSL